MPHRKWADGNERQRAYNARKRDRLWRTSQPGCRLNRDRNSGISVLSYFGGKFRLSPWVIQQFPAHTTYVEPFAGGAAVLFRKGRSSHEVLSDLNAELMHFWATLRAAPTAFVTCLHQHSWSRQSWEWSVSEDASTDVERAVAFYLRNWLSHGGGTRRWQTGFREKVTEGSKRNAFDDGKLLWAARRLGGVTLRTRDAFDVIQEFNRVDVLLYVDPPYLPETRQGTDDYSHEMSRADHERLLAALCRSSAMVVLSGYPNELYHDTLRGWRYVEKSASTRGTSRTEGLWISPNCDPLSRLPLFYWAASNE